MEPVAIVADVTEMETRPPAFPGHVEALEALGFRQLGRFATLSGRSRYDNAYGRAERNRLDAWRQRSAAAVLVAPDGSAFAGVDTFGDAPLLRLRTELDDGSVVETVATEREGALRPRRGDPFAGFTGTDTPDHPVRLVLDTPPAAVVAAHREHVAAVVAERGAHPVRHTDRDHALRLATRAVDHMTRVRQRGLRLIRGVATAVAVPLGVLVFWLQISSGMSLLTILLTDLLFIPVGLLLISAVLVPVSRSARWRPSFNIDR